MRDTRSPSKHRRLIAPLFAFAILGACIGAWAAIPFDYELNGPGPASNSGRHLISLPSQITDPPLSDCGDLLAHIPNAVSVSRWARSTDTFEPCQCPTPACFPIVPGDAWLVEVSADSAFTIEGGDGSVTLLLQGPGPFSATGTNFFSHPFVSPITSARTLFQDISTGGPVAAVQQYLTTTDSFQVYTIGSPDFALQPGHGYGAIVAQDILYDTKVITEPGCGNCLLEPDEECDPPGPFACDCCGATGIPGCSNATCEDSVCDIDPNCCGAITCPDCFTVDANRQGCSNRQCEDRVCALNRDCCDQGWKPECVALAAEFPECNHCNDGLWDEICGTEAHKLLECRLCCDDPGLCSDSCCTDTDGDGLCDAEDACPAGPNRLDTGTSFFQNVLAIESCDCCEAHPGSGCSDVTCETAICSFDPFCCDVEWDFQCAIEAQSETACSSCCDEGEFIWVAPLDYDWIQGSFAASLDVGGYIVEASGTDSGNTLSFQDTEGLASGEGDWFLLSPVCPDPTWSTTGTGEIQCEAPSDCCEAHAGPGCTGTPCESAVCLVDPGCCLWCPDCGVDQGPASPGCSNRDCQDAVCADDPFCCEVTWDQFCADAALVSPACTDCLREWDDTCAAVAGSIPMCVNSCDGTLCREASLP